MITDCEKQIGYVVFDCFCLMLGAAEVRATFTAEAAEEVAEAARPAMSKFDQYILTIASEESSTTEIAGAVFNVVSTCWSAGCLGEVFSAWMGTLTLGDKILYGATGMATMLAAFATDGAAEIGVIAVELATCGWLVDDSIKCADKCSYA